MGLHCKVVCCTCHAYQHLLLAMQQLLCCAAWGALSCHLQKLDQSMLACTLRYRTIPPASALAAAAEWSQIAGRKNLVQSGRWSTCHSKYRQVSRLKMQLNISILKKIPQTVCKASTNKATQQYVLWTMPDDVVLQKAETILF